MSIMQPKLNFQTPQAGIEKSFRTTPLRLISNKKDILWKVWLMGFDRDGWCSSICSSRTEINRDFKTIGNDEDYKESYALFA